MFLFVIRYFGFLKNLPGMVLLFDGMLRLQSFVINASVLDHIDGIEADVTVWPGIAISTHKYGGLQFNYGGHEIGHIHSNGLLDMLLSLKEKKLLMISGRVQDHHTFKNTGWISFYIKTGQDKDYAIELLKMAYKSYEAKQII